MKKLKTNKKEIVSANIILVEVGTNCPQGGDKGHGGRTYLKFENVTSTEFKIKVDDQEIDDPQKIEIILYGDSEYETIVGALEFAAGSLRSQFQINSSGPKGSVKL